MFFFLAIRNIVKSKKTNILIVLCFAAITFVFFMGNSVLGRANKSLHQAYVESLTGDVVLQKSADVTMNLFGANAPVMEDYFTIPVLPAYDTITEIIAAEKGIAGITSQVSGMAYIKIFDIDEPVLLCGIDAESYFPLFPGIILEEGRLLRPGEFGAMITKERAERIGEKSGRHIETRVPLLFTLATNAGVKLREIPLVGIFSYKNPGNYMNEVVILDAQTTRELNSIQVAGGSEVELGEDVLGLLSADPDDIFGDAFFSGAVPEEEFSADLLQNYLSESKAGEIVPETGGDWNFIIIRLEKGISADSFISSINKKIAPYGLTAVNWRTAAGESAILLILVQALFNAGVFLVSVAGVIAAINILLISVFRRTREIGTLRAIGASDAYIRSLIICENLIIAIIAGLAGVFGGFLFFKWINSLDLHIANTLLASLLGGAALHLDFLPHIAVFSVTAAILLGLAASLYPVEVAVRIEPMAAVRRG